MSRRRCVQWLPSHEVRQVAIRFAVAWLSLQCALQVLAASTADTTPRSVGAASDLLEALRVAQARIGSLVADVDIAAYDTCAYKMLDGSQTPAPTSLDNVTEVVELSREQWTGPVSKRLHWELQGDWARMETWQGEIAPEAGQQGPGCPVYLTCVFDGSRSSELQVAGPRGFRRGRVFAGKFYSYFHPYDLCFVSEGEDFVLPTVEGDRYRFEATGDPEEVGGHTCYRLSLRSKPLGKVQLAVWLDPSAGWMPRQIERYAIRDTRDCRATGNCELVFMTRYENIQLAEVAEETWFPVSAEETSLRPQIGDPTKMVPITKSYIAIDPSTLRVNQPIPPDHLTLDWPTDTVVADQESHTAYHVGASTEKVMEVQLQGIGAQVRANPKADLFQASSVQPSQGRSLPAPLRSPWRWWSVFGAGCIVGLTSTVTAFHWIQRGH